MKIKSVYISSFGTLKDLTLDFDDKFTVVFGENENGKTTVMEFIKAVFYGMSNRSKAKLSLREKYRPWQGDVMGGRILFESGGTNYLIEREFKNSDSADKVLLINKDTGETVPSVKNIGEEFIGLTEQSFERSVFIDNDTVFTYDAAASSDINGKLSNGLLSGDTEISSEKVIKNLTGEKLKMLTKTGKGGTLPAEIELLKTLGEQKENSLRLAEKKSLLTNTLLGFEEKLKGLLNKREISKSIVERENDAKNTEKLKSYIEKSEKLAEIEKSLALKDGSVLNTMFVNAVTLGINKFENYAAKCDEARDEIEQCEKALSLSSDGKTAKEKLDELNKTLENLNFKSESTAKECEEKSAEIERLKAEELSTRHGGLKIVFLCLAIIFSAAALVFEFYFSNLFYSAFTGIPAAVFYILCIFTKKRKNNSVLIEKLLEELNALRIKKDETADESAKILNEISTVSANIKAAETISEQKKQEISVKKEALFELITKRDTAKTELLKYFSKFSDVTDIEEIKRICDSTAKPLEEIKTLKVEILMLSGDLGDINLQKAKQRLQLAGDTENIDFAAEKERFNSLNEDIVTVKERISSLNTELKTAFADYIPPETVEREIRRLSEEVEAKVKFCKAVDTAKAAIEESALLMRKNYGSALEEKAAQNFNALTKGKYKTVNISKEMDLSVEETEAFGTRETDYLSKGTVHQAYLALRLAIASMLSEKESLPVLLDDSLSQYDDKRLLCALDFLKEHSVLSQVILFTCHGFVKDSAKEKEIKILSLKKQSDKR